MVIALVAMVVWLATRRDVTSTIESEQTDVTLTSDAWCGCGLAWNGTHPHTLVTLASLAELTALVGAGRALEPR